MKQIDYTPGQRWISTTEPDLGLGILTDIGNRTVTVRFLASDEARTYSVSGAPISRVKLEIGDNLETIEGEAMQVVSVTENHGLLTYECLDSTGNQQQLDELELSHFMHFSRPQDRLLTGQIDKDHWFDLRHKTLLHDQRLSQNELIGLGGARTALLPHQLHIAREAGRRPHPRILLADEVGLGKTIEACLIVHHLLLSGQATRALILVPTPLLHQWLVELMRRFNLQFSLFDEERCQAIESSDQATNPFMAEQLVLSSLDLFTNSADRLKQAQKGDWDILVIDEAHHLEWHETAPSAAYNAAEVLCHSIPSVLLLTATPEQLGREGHFARLRLLDPDRYFDLHAFLDEETQYQPVADAVGLLISEDPLSQAGSEAIQNILKDESMDSDLKTLTDNATNVSERQQAKQKVVRLLLDRYGPGRAMFRNTRDRVKGLGKRELHAYPLDLPETYQAALENETDPYQKLTPERLASAGTWWQIDPRFAWLLTLLKQLGDEKLLLICAHAETAIELGEALRQKEGIHAALFHEQLTIVERDRAAAWFADQEQGCQLMICSEIGSEGRNFQFAHHLALFDLPSDPDLLEQRIGRLDRIGQTQTIRLHLPYFKSSAQEVLFRWYDEGLNIFNQTCPAAAQILEQLRPVLTQSMEEVQQEPEALELLISTTHTLHEEISERLKQGRDHLLELNSFPEEDAQSLKSAVSAIDQSTELSNFMASIFDAYGVETEYHTAHSIVIKPGNKMINDDFLALPADGLTATYHRASALAHENWHFLTWEHPMVTDSIENLLDGEMGNSSAIAITLPGVKGNPLLLELLYVLECSAPKALQAGRFLPPTLIRVVIDQNLNDLSDKLTTASIEKLAQRLNRNVAKKIIQPLRERILSMIKGGDEIANRQCSTITTQALEATEQHYQYEIDRLHALSQINQNIRESEVTLLKDQSKDLIDHLTSSRVRLDSVRMLIGM